MAHSDNQVAAAAAAAAFKTQTQDCLISFGVFFLN